MQVSSKVLDYVRTDRMINLLERYSRPRSVSQVYFHGIYLRWERNRRKAEQFNYSLYLLRGVKPAPFCQMTSVKSKYIRFSSLPRI